MLERILNAKWNGTFDNYIYATNAKKSHMMKIQKGDECYLITFHKNGFCIDQTFINPKNELFSKFENLYEQTQNKRLNTFIDEYFLYDKLIYAD